MLAGIKFQSSNITFESSKKKKKLRHSNGSTSGDNFIKTSHTSTTKQVEVEMDIKHQRPFEKMLKDTFSKGINQGTSFVERCAEFMHVYGEQLPAFPAAIASVLLPQKDEGEISLLEYRKRLKKIKKEHPEINKAYYKFINRFNLPIAEKLLSDRTYPRGRVFCILANTTKNNISLAERLCFDKDFPPENITGILIYTENADKEKLRFAEKLCFDKDFPKQFITDILIPTNKVNLPLAEKLCLDKKFPKHGISNILKNTTKLNLPLAEKLCFDKEFSKENIVEILYRTKDTYKEKLRFAEALCFDKDFPKEMISAVLKNTNTENISLAKKLCFDKEFPKYYISDILKQTRIINKNMAERLCFDKEFPKEMISAVLGNTDEENISLAEKLCFDKEFPKHFISDILKQTRIRNKDIAERLCFDKEFPKEMISILLSYTTLSTLPFGEKLCRDKEVTKADVMDILRVLDSKNLKTAEELYEDKDVPRNIIPFILSFSQNNTPEHIALIKKLNSEKIPTESIKILMSQINAVQSVNFESLLKDDDFVTIVKFLNIYDAREYLLRWDYLTSDGTKLIDLIDKVLEQKDIMLKKPEKYTNHFEDDTLEEMQWEINDLVERNMHSLISLAKAFDKDTLNNLLRLRTDNAEEYLEEIGCSFFDDELQLLSDLCNAKNIDGKAFTGKQKIEFINLISAYQKQGLSLKKIEDMAKSGVVDIKKLNYDLFKEILKKIDISEADIQQIPNEKNSSWQLKYIHFLAKELNEYEFDEDDDIAALKDVIRAATFEPDFKNYIQDTTNPYGVTNAKNQKRFKKAGLNYEKWVNPPKNIEVQFTSKDKNQEQLSQIEAQLTEDINTLRKNSFVKKFIDGQFPKFIKNDEFFFPANISSSKAKLKEFTEHLIKQLDGVWKSAKSNLQNSEKATKARNILTILDHLKQRISDIENVEENGNKKSNLDLTIKMWDRIPQKDIFQGNYSTCCIGMGQGNGWSMPYYLMNTAFNMIELVNNISGETIGNALCYFVQNKQGKPAFVIDNIEINNKIKPSEQVGYRLRNAILGYAANLTKELTGKEDTPIYIGSSFNDLPFDDMKEQEEEKVSFLGVMSNEHIYLDLFDGDEYTDELTKDVCAYSTNYKNVKKLLQRNF